MASEGPLSAGTGADDASFGDVTWNDPTNIYTANGAYAWAGLFSDLSSHYLVATNFGFAIPSGATVDGIVADVRRLQHVAQDVKDSRVRIVKGGAIGATDRSNGSAWPTSFTYEDYGSASDLWGEAWTAADINSSTFGLALVAVNSTGVQSYAEVDHVQITVHYTVAATAPGRMALLGVGT